MQVSRFGGMKFSVGKNFCFYFMFKTMFSTKHDIWVGNIFGARGDTGLDMSKKFNANESL